MPLVWGTKMGLPHTDCKYDFPLLRLGHKDLKSRDEGRNADRTGQGVGVGRL